jgi:hypothetical protein
VENMMAIQKTTTRIIVFSPLKLRHRYFLRTLIANNIIIDAIVVIKAKANIVMSLDKIFSITFVLDKFLTSIEFLLKGMVTLPNIKKISVKNYNEDEVCNEIKRGQIQAVVVYGGPIIPTELLNQAQVQFINIHGAILPGYRGLDSHWWLFLEKKFDLQGFTIHLIDENIDSGKIIKTRNFDNPILSLTRIFLWRIWIAQNSAVDLVHILNMEKFDNELIVHNLSSSTYRSAISISNILKQRVKRVKI